MLPCSNIQSFNNLLVFLEPNFLVRNFLKWTLRPHLNTTILRIFLKISIYCEEHNGFKKYKKTIGLMPVLLIFFNTFF